MSIQKGLKYSKEHEWVKLEGNRAAVGITDYAQQALGDIVFVELPKIGVRLCSGDVLGVVESVKTASDVYSPVSGTVVEVNEALTDAPERLNSAPYESWIAVLELDDPSEADCLMDETAYGEFCAKGV